MGKDTIADIMTSIRNADMNGRGTVLIPCTNITENIAKMFLREGFIENVRKHREWGNLFLVLTLPYRRNRKGSSKTRLNLKRISTISMFIFKISMAKKKIHYIQYLCGVKKENKK
ncbi:hypothetical protein AHAS_Ahas01G0128200 [Arachis hypogaea]